MHPNIKERERGIDDIDLWILEMKELIHLSLIATRNICVLF